MNTQILSIGRDAKTRKSVKVGVLTGVVYLQPVKRGGGRNLCRYAGACALTCIIDSGRLAMEQAQNAAMRRTRLYLESPDAFFYILEQEIEYLVAMAERLGLRPGVRLDGTSDDVTLQAYIRGLIARFPNVAFYGYTKRPLDDWRGALALPNVWTTYSLNERSDSWDHALDYLGAGYSVAAVFRDKAAVARVLERGSYAGFPVLNGDEHDARFQDAAGHIVALYAKGKARKADGRGFILDASEVTAAAAK